MKRSHLRRTRLQLARLKRARSAATPLAGAGRIVGRIGYPYTVLYDGNCRVCTHLANILAGWDAHRVLEITPVQTAGIHARFPWVPPRAFLESIHLVRNSDGTTWEGAAALETLIDVMPKGKWIGWIFAIPFVRPVADHLYRWFARHRYQLGCGEHCQVPSDSV